MPVSVYVAYYSHLALQLLSSVLMQCTDQWCMPTLAYFGKIILCVLPVAMYHRTFVWTFTNVLDSIIKLFAVWNGKRAVGKTSLRVYKYNNVTTSYLHH